jgi:tRNA pseudouridine55 synthase
MTEKNSLTGFLLINKPKNYTSFDCIRHIKRIIKQNIKIGHTGTLDDFATGLLIIGIGRPATKLSDTLLNLDKEYIVKVKLGELTNTLDKTGTVIEQKDPKHISQKDIKNAIQKLGTSYTQVPPIYSALKYKGKPLYKLAREQKISDQKLKTIVKQKRRTVQIYDIQLLSFDTPCFIIKTTVSKGTYIRSLANDIAHMLDMPATTYELQRTKIGPLDIKDAIDLESIKTLQDIEKHIISIKHIQTLLY